MIFSRIFLIGLVVCGVFLCYLPILIFHHNLNVTGKETHLARALGSWELHDALLSSVVISLPLIIEHLFDNTMTSRKGNLFRLVRVMGLFIPNVIILLMTSRHALNSSRVVDYIPSILSSQFVIYNFGFFSLLQKLDPQSWSDNGTLTISLLFTFLSVLNAHRKPPDEYDNSNTHRNFDIGICVIFGVCLILFLGKTIHWLFHIYRNSIRQGKSLDSDLYSCAIQIFAMSIFLIGGRGVVAVYYGFVPWQDVTASNFAAWIYIDVASLMLNTIFTDRLSRKELLLAQNALEIKRNFVNYISHEMRTPLNTVSLGLKLLHDTIQSDLFHRKDILAHIHNDEKEFEDEDDEGLRVIEERLDILDDMRASCEIAVTTLNELLTFDKLESGILKLDLEDIQIWTFLIDTIKPFEVQARQAGIDLIIDNYENIELVLKDRIMRGDEHKLAQVLRNFISNGLKFTPKGGKVTVIIRLELCSNGVSPPPGTVASSGMNMLLTADKSDLDGTTTIELEQNEIKVDYKSNIPTSVSVKNIRGASFQTLGSSTMALFPQNNRPSSSERPVEQAVGVICDRLVIQVVDTGVGISVENQKKVFREVVQFNPGKLQKGGGSGLGLYITRGIVELHHGTVSVHSEGEGHGCTFTVTLPLAGPDAMSPRLQEAQRLSGITSVINNNITEISNQVVKNFDIAAYTSISHFSRSYGLRDDDGISSSASTPDCSSLTPTGTSNMKLFDHATGVHELELSAICELSSRQTSRSDIEDIGPREDRLNTVRLDENLLFKQESQELAPFKIHKMGGSNSNNNENKMVTTPITTAIGSTVQMLGAITKGDSFVSDIGSLKSFKSNSRVNVMVEQVSTTVSNHSVPSLRGSCHSDAPSLRGSISESKVMSSPPKRDLLSLRRNRLSHRDSPPHMPPSSLPSSSHPRRRLSDIKKKSTIDDKLRILVVDDSLMSRKMLCRHLRPRSGVIYEADNGVDALKVIQECSHTGMTIDVVLMDHEMPEMDGPTAAKAMRSHGFRGLIVGITGHALPRDRQHFMTSGADLVFTKPLDMNLLEEALKEFEEPHNRRQSITSMAPIEHLIKMLSRDESFHIESSPHDSSSKNGSAWSIGSSMQSIRFPPPHNAAARTNRFTRDQSMDFEEKTL